MLVDLQGAPRTGSHLSTDSNVLNAYTTSRRIHTHDLHLDQRLLIVRFVYRIHSEGLSEALNEAQIRNEAS